MRKSQIQPAGRQAGRQEVNAKLPFYVIRAEISNLFHQHARTRNRFFFLRTSRPAVRPTYPPIQWDPTRA